MNTRDVWKNRVLSRRTVSDFWRAIHCRGKRNTERKEHSSTHHIKPNFEKILNIFARNKETNLPSIQLPFYVCNSSLLLRLLCCCISIVHTRCTADPKARWNVVGDERKNSSHSKQIFFGFLELYIRKTTHITINIHLRVYECV